MLKKLSILGIVLMMTGCTNGDVNGISQTTQTGIKYTVETTDIGGIITVDHVYKNDWLKGEAEYDHTNVRIGDIVFGGKS